MQHVKILRPLAIGRNLGNRNLEREVGIKLKKCLKGTVKEK